MFGSSREDRRQLYEAKARISALEGLVARQQKVIDNYHKDLQQAKKEAHLKHGALADRNKENTKLWRENRRLHAEIRVWKEAFMREQKGKWGFEDA